MDTKDQTLRMYLQGVLPGEIKEVPEDELCLHGHTPDSASRTEVLSVTLPEPPVERSLVALAATYILLCGYDVMARECALAPRRVVDADVLEAFDHAYIVLGFEPGMNGDDGKNPKIHIMVAHNMRLAAFTLVS